MRSAYWLFLILLTGCVTNEEELPILSYVISESGEKTYYSVSYQDKGFSDQLNNSFNDSFLEDKVFLANFFFTSCPSICPPMRSALIDVANNLSEESQFMIISHTIDPKNDTHEVLLNYSETTGISNEGWYFLRSSVEKTKAMANQFMTNFKPNEDGTDFYHSSYVALVDKEQQIRGFYNTLITEDLLRLKDDIEKLLK